MALEPDDERRVELAVDAALRGGSSRFDHLPAPLEAVARNRWKERLAAGEGPSDVVYLSGTSGSPLVPTGGSRGAAA